MIVSDATSLIILFDLKRVDLLSNIFTKIYIPFSVYDELTFKSTPKLPELLNSLKNLLDIGESEAKELLEDAICGGYRINKKLIDDMMEQL